MRGEAVVAGARALKGVPFRLHGRDARTGVDCVGLAVLALQAAGYRDVMQAAPTAYRLRGGQVEQMEDCFLSVGLEKVGQEKAGDVLLVQAGVAQFHLMVATGDGYIHAHAGVGRVVESPGALAWPLISRWR